MAVCNQQALDGAQRAVCECAFFPVPGVQNCLLLAAGRKGRSQHGHVHLYVNPPSHLYLSISRRGAVSTRPDLC